MSINFNAQPMGQFNFQFVSIWHGLLFVGTIILAIVMPGLFMYHASQMGIPEESHYGAFWASAFLVAFIAIAGVALGNDGMKKFVADLAWPIVLILAVGFFGSLLASGQSDWWIEGLMGVPIGGAWASPFIVLSQQKWEPAK